MRRAYYSDQITAFLGTTPAEILGRLAERNEFSLEQTQRDAWLSQISLLQTSLVDQCGKVYFEFSVPRIGHRIDVVLLIGAVIFVLEFKVGEVEFTSGAVDQVWDYALDLKYFHEGSHIPCVLPVLIATHSKSQPITLNLSKQNDNLYHPVRIIGGQLAELISLALAHSAGDKIDVEKWESSRYLPSPTIVEAALALYNGHSVIDIARTDAGAINLSETSNEIDQIIAAVKRTGRKAICFVTGVPGAGKTLVGLNIATKHIDKESDLYSVFLSGNKPLVDVMREALARDKVQRGKQQGRRVKKGQAMTEVKMFIQNVHHFRDDCIADSANPPREHVAIFDEAQRAWNLEQTSSFMQRKKGVPNFNQSEPEFLISCMDRHPDWAVIVCLVGGGQEINTGEAGISEWLKSLQNTFRGWDIYVSTQLTDSEYGIEKIGDQLHDRPHVISKSKLHLATSMRSFRSENVSRLVKRILDIEIEQAQSALLTLKDKYAIVLTRDVKIAKKWLRDQARGSERYGIVVSSQALRLKPYAMDVRTPVDPVHWFLDDKFDVRSSYYLEDVATEFQVQGLEIDWACVTWDADLRYTNDGWEHWSFVGSRWNRIRKIERQKYLLNAYRVLLTRARQGMVIVVPEGDQEDLTRKSEYYDNTFNFLNEIGFPII